MSRYNRKNRRKYNLKVHIVLVTKYRKNIIIDKIKDSLKAAVLEVAAKYKYNIIAMVISIISTIKNIKNFAKIRVDIRADKKI